MSHLPDPTLEEIDQYLQSSFPEGQKYVLITSEPQSEEEETWDYDFLSNLNHQEASTMLKDILKVIDQRDEPPIQYAG